MAVKTAVKRPYQGNPGPSKKRKVAPGKDSHGKKAKGGKEKSKGKERASQRPTIPIPNQGDEYEPELSDQDLDLLEEYGTQASFLGRLDEKGIARSKAEQDRLHRMNKPVRKAVEDDLPSINSHSSDEDDDDAWDSNMEDNFSQFGSDDDEDDISDAGPSSRGRQDWDADAEMPYETVPRKRRASWDRSDEDKAVDRLPIKLADGRIQKTGEKILLQAEDADESEEEEEIHMEAPEPPRREDISTGARFGRLAVVDVIANKSRKLRLQGAKEQIAGICQEIVADPENSLGLLRRLHSFALAEISTATHPEPVANDPVIRKLAILSQLAVFKDIIPGYRIRALTDLEKAEKVSQIVSRQREWEQGLVGVYQSYLRLLEKEIKDKTDLAETALRCMCTLLTDVTHFNFRVNLMGVVVARLSRRSWDELSDLCLNTLISVLRSDETGLASLEVVRLLNRMVKERKFRMHPDVLTCLLYLRLKTELGVRASQATVERLDTKAKKSKKPKKGEAVHLSKKAKKARKENKEIEKEMKEAEADIDREERAANQTETLKLVFVLYFRILKNPVTTPLLPAALQGISKFAHLVSIDFFKDLMTVLKDLIERESHDAADAADPRALTSHDSIRHRLSCIVTAFELLSGQGEALNIDLGDFLMHLYAIILPLSLSPSIEAPPRAASARTRAPSASELLFRALALAFSPHATAGAAPPWRAAAFAKRLLTAALHWPPATAVRALECVEGLVARDTKLEALLSSEDRTVDGVYRPDLDDPQLANPFATSLYELQLLRERHLDGRVRAAAARVAGLAKA
ncbi:nucleolar complex-associated protein 3 [Dentipellis sp. KUC8613]|nr:nucleolar complex-associated protein 3 [Dentipellis sp. KUC8613]